MASMDSSYRLGIGLALCLAWVTFGTPAQADAMSESPFTLNPPTGWQRYVHENGTVRFVDPTNEHCSVFISPHASNIGPEKDESWLRSAFDIERDRVIKYLTALGSTFSTEVDKPTLGRIADRTFASHGSFLMKEIENGDEIIRRIRMLVLFRRDSMQEIISVADDSACDDDVITSFLNNAIRNIELANVDAEKPPASLHQTQSQEYRSCISHCATMFIICNIAPPPSVPTCGQQNQACNENCPSPPSSK